MEESPPDPEVAPPGLKTLAGPREQRAWRSSESGTLIRWRKISRKPSAGSEGQSGVPMGQASWFRTELSAVIFRGRKTPKGSESTGRDRGCQVGWQATGPGQ
jgi:hypothetical protein